MTMGVLMASVPAVLPFDNMYGEAFDLLAQEMIFHQLILLKIIAFLWFGTPCRSFSFARLPELRCSKHIKGKPRLKPHQLEIVRAGNLLAEYTARICWHCLDQSCHFGVENPFPSWLWATPEFLRLASDPRVSMVLSAFQSFDAPWFKLTGVLHNSPVLHMLDIGETLIKASVTLRGVLPNGEALTSFASPYPPKWCKLGGVLVAKSMEMKLEAEEAGLSVPMALQEFHFESLSVLTLSI